MSEIPGTKVEVNCFSFGGPPTKDQRSGTKKQQPPLYYAQGEGTLPLASVNAGNSGSLGLGGGGVNLGFQDHLSQTFHHLADFETRHKKLLDKADNGGEPWEHYSTADPCAFSFVNPGRIGKFPGWYAGVCFVDVFDTSNPDLCPDSNPLNVAMLYAAPPEDDYYGTDSDDDAAKTQFLAAIETMAVKIIQTVSAYNALAEQKKLPSIKALRNTLYSSGIYNQNLQLDRSEIARAIFRGMSAELKKDPNSGLEELQFPVGNGERWQDDLFAAVKKDLASSTATVVST